MSRLPPRLPLPSTNWLSYPQLIPLMFVAQANLQSAFACRKLHSALKLPLSWSPVPVRSPVSLLVLSLLVLLFTRLLTVKLMTSRLVLVVSLGTQKLRSLLTVTPLKSFPALSHLLNKEYWQCNQLQHSGPC
jgi:hypothetical protein